MEVNVRHIMDLLGEGKNEFVEAILQMMDAAVRSGRSVDLTETAFRPWPSEIEDKTIVRTATKPEHIIALKEEINQIQKIFHRQEIK